MNYTGSEGAETYYFALRRQHLYLLLAVILAVDALLIAANFSFALKWHIVPHFLKDQLNMDREAVFGAWYPSMLLFTLALLALFNYNLDLTRGHGWWARGWLGIFLVTLMLSADEVSAIHERIGGWFGDKIGGIDFLPQAYAWVLIFAPFVLAVVVFYLLFFIRRFRHSLVSRNLALAGTALWLLAVIFESLANLLFSARTINLERAFEESSELMGTTLLLIAFALTAMESH
ncbi:MAG: hypothetical protein Q9P90_03265 [candidate division KSB1 bacterium]|nr:hypothetical protein [candidate division KSB1 bacterium]